MAKIGKTIGELNGWNAQALKFTIWGVPVGTAVIAALFVPVILPWFQDIAATKAATAAKLDRTEYIEAERKQEKELQAYVELQVTESRNQVAELKDDIKSDLHEINKKLDQIIWSKGEALAQ